MVLQEWLTFRTSAPCSRILDLGCGAGASSLAAAMSLKNPAVALTSIDHSLPALGSLQKLFHDCHALWPQATLQTLVRDVRADGLDGPFDLILASFVVNELFPGSDDTVVERWLRGQIARLAPGGSLAVIEPAGAATCERLQRLRNRFAADPTVRILAPCPHSHPCPLLNAGCGYCHDVRSWRVPDSVNIINRNMLRSVSDLKHGLLVLGRQDTSSPPWSGDPDAFRMVAPMNRAKGRLVTRGCCGDGRLREIELQTRGLTRSQTDAICAWERGDVLRMREGRPLGDGRVWRAAGLEPICVIGRKS